MYFYTICDVSDRQPAKQLIVAELNGPKCLCPSIRGNLHGFLKICLSKITYVYFRCQSAWVSQVDSYASLVVECGAL